VRPPLPREPPDEIVVRTSRFRFHMGVRVDEAWLVNAEETRVALGRAVAVLLEDEDTATMVLAKQLGVEWPAEPLDFDVVLSEADGAPSCETGLPRRLKVGIGTPAPELFFACVLERSFARLADESALLRATSSAHRTEVRDCLVKYAVAAVIVSGTPAARVSHALERRLGASCPAAELDFLVSEWVKRVRGDETAEAFGARVPSR
jgi:hypothetical protein